MSNLASLMERNFLEYASYVIVDRAIPDLRDGCKPVQRRILTTLFNVDDGKFHKVANVIGETMKLHPHGDASIGDALVVLANKEYFIEKQGNFGNILTGHAAAAPRYIECRLTELAKETLFNEALTTYQLSYDGRNQEPIFLPAKLPTVLLLGTEGIAVGMSTKILPHNLGELLAAQIKILRNEPAEVYPDFLQGGLLDVSEYADGLGKIKVRAKIEAVGDKKVVIREIPYGTTTESLIASIEAAVQKDKVKISTINDFTTDKVEIELNLARGVYTHEVIPQLYAYTDCEVSIALNLAVIDKRQPVELPVTEVLKLLTAQLKGIIKAELEYTINQLEDKQHWLTLEQIFIENRVYKRIEKETTDAGVTKAVYLGMEPFKADFLRPLSDEDVKRLLALRIRRISAFDIQQHHEEIQAVKRNIQQAQAKLKSLTKTTITFLEGLLRKYGPLYPRRTKLMQFTAVDRKAVARQNIKISYDPESGFLGSEVKGSQYNLTVSEYDVILAIAEDGTFKILTPQPKILFTSPLLYCEVFNPEKGAIFTVVYRTSQRLPFAKKVHIEKFIRNKEYQLLKDGRIDLLLVGDVQDKIVLNFAKKGGAKVGKGKNAREPAPTIFSLADLTFMGLTTKGLRLADKPVNKITLLAE